MKNYFAIALTCVYLTLSVGVAKTTHYCMGRESSSSVFSFQTKPCVCEIWLQKPGSCCDDEHELIKIQSEQSHSSIILLSAPDFFEIGTLYSELFTTTDHLSSLNLSFEQARDEPPPLAEPLFMMHCSLVFYDDEPAA